MAAMFVMPLSTQAQTRQVPLLHNCGSMSDYVKFREAKGGIRVMVQFGSDGHWELAIDRFTNGDLNIMVNMHPRPEVCTLITIKPGAVFNEGFLDKAFKVPNTDFKGLLDEIDRAVVKGERG